MLFFLFSIVFLETIKVIRTIDFMESVHVHLWLGDGDCEQNV